MVLYNTHNILHSAIAYCVNMMRYTNYLHCTGNTEFPICIKVIMVSLLPCMCLHELCDRCWSPNIIIIMYCDPKNNLNGILAVDLPFQALAVDLSSNL